MMNSSSEFIVLKLIIVLKFKVYFQKGEDLVIFRTLKWPPDYISIQPESKKYRNTFQALTNY
jgi:hypothetical protein